MVRPKIINKKKKSKGKKRGNPGGKFQDEFRIGIESSDGFGMRIPDKMNVGPGGQMIRMKGSTTPADFFYTNKRGVYLIESKTVKLAPGKTQPVRYTGRLDWEARVDGHQKDALMEMDAISEFHHGYLAVKLYNGLNTKDRISECYLLNIRTACDIIKETGLKSINQDKIREHGIPVDWVPSNSKKGTKAYWDIGGVLD